MHQRGVDGHPIEPATDLGSVFKTSQLFPGGYEHFLKYFFSIVVVADQTLSQPQERCFVASQQLPKGERVALLGAFHQGDIAQAREVASAADDGRGQPFGGRECGGSRRRGHGEGSKVGRDAACAVSCPDLGVRRGRPPGLRKPYAASAIARTSSHSRPERWTSSCGPRRLRPRRWWSFVLGRPGSPTGWQSARRRRSAGRRCRKSPRQPG